MEVYVKRGQ